MGNGLLGQRSAVVTHEGSRTAHTAPHGVPDNHAAHNLAIPAFIQAIGDCVQPRSGEDNPQTQHACCRLRHGSSLEL